MTSASRQLPSTPVAALGSPPPTLWADAFRHLLRRRASRLSLAVILIFLVISIGAPWLSPHDPTRLDPGNNYLPPFWMGATVSRPSGSLNNMLGTDVAGRDVLSRLIFGARTTLVISLGTVAVTALVGTLLGGWAGYSGGRVDRVITTFINIFYAFPMLLFTIMVLLIFEHTPLGRLENGLFSLLLTLIAINWVGIARLVRSAVLVLRGETYVEASRSLGASPGRLLFQHILPNCFNLVLVWITFTIPKIIIIEATLGYLGIGFAPIGDPQQFFVTSWGGMVSEARRALSSAPWIVLSVATCIGLIGMAFTFLGDALRDALDPRMRDLP